MKHFLRLVAWFALPLVVFGIGTEILLRKIPNDYSYKKNYLDQNSRNLKVLYLGSSHAFYGINPEYNREKSFNAAYVSQSLNFDFQLLKKYGDRWDSLKFIVIPVDYFSLYGKLETGAEAWRVKNYTIYYGMNTTLSISDHSELLSNKLKASASRIYRYYIRHKSAITCSGLGWGQGYSFEKKQDLMVTGKSAAQRHTGRSDRYFNENIEALKSIIEFARAKKIKVLLYTSPAYKTYVQNLEPGQLHRTLREVAKIADSYSNTVYVSFLTDSTFTENDFYDADHLNDIGAKRFTLKINSLLTALE